MIGGSVGTGLGVGVGIGFGCGLPPEPGTVEVGGCGGGCGSERVTGGAWGGGAAGARSPAAATISAHTFVCWRRLGAYS